VHSILEQLDLLSANECLRQLGEEWHFHTIEIQGLRLMAGRDLARLVYGVDNPANIHRMLARFWRKPLYLQSYSQNSKVKIRRELGIHTSATSVSLVTWADVLIVAMRGQTEWEKELQQYLLKAERENRIQWTMEQLRKSEILTRAITMLTDRVTQINWVKRRNKAL
jgi:hypothetical protein